MGDAKSWATKQRKKYLEKRGKKNLLVSEKCLSMGLLQFLFPTLSNLRNQLLIRLSFDNFKLIWKKELKNCFKLTTHSITWRYIYIGRHGLRHNKRKIWWKRWDLKHIQGEKCTNRSYTKPKLHISWMLISVIFIRYAHAII